jgi:phosphopantetheinyl transferase
MKYQIETNIQKLKMELYLRAMSIHLYTYSKGETRIHLTEVSSMINPLHVLTSSEIEKWERFTHQKRKDEFLTTRAIRTLRFNLNEITYSANGAPYLENGPYISISHATGLVGLAENDKYSIGLDLEIKANKAIRLHSKFLSENEQVVFNCNSETEMTACWSAKETLYKLAGRKKIDFKKELLLSPIEKNLWLGKIINPDHERWVKIAIFEHNEYIITFNTSPIEFIYY